MKLPSPLKALIFDLDDTLVVEKASAEAAFLKTCELVAARYDIAARDLRASVRETCRGLWHASPVRPYAVEVGISSWEALWARFEGEDDNLRFLHAWAPTYRRDSWYQALRRHAIDDADVAIELAEAFGRYRRELHLVYDDVRPTLEALRPQFRLGLLTNGAPDLQREKIAGAGIAGYFDAIVISGDFGFGKPNPLIYEAILTRLGLGAHETLMVGDSLSADIRGAQKVGMKALWVNRARHPRDDSVVPDIELDSLAPLPEILTVADAP